MSLREIFLLPGLASFLGIPVTGGFLLQETTDKFLLEDGFRLTLE